MTDVPRLLAVSFLLAVGALLVAFGVVLGRVGGGLVAAVYAVVVVAALVLGAQLAKRRARSAALERGHTCSCCTGTVHDPVKVI